MNHNYRIESDVVCLLPLTKDDVEELRILRNKEKEFFFSNNDITKEAQKIWYQHYLKKDDDIMFKVVFTENRSVFVGAVALYNIDYELKMAEFGRIIIDKERAPHNGVGTNVVKLIICFAKQLSLSKVYAEVKTSNKRAIHVYQKAGMHIVGNTKNDELLMEIII